MNKNRNREESLQEPQEHQEPPIFQKFLIHLALETLALLATTKVAQEEIEIDFSHQKCLNQIKNKKMNKIQ